MTAYAQTYRGTYHISQAWEQVWRSRYRIGNAALERYELYIGEGAEPDFSADPAETFNSLPHTTTTELEANHVYRLCTRLRNEYGLVSGNVNTCRIETDTDGDQEAVHPSNPFEVKVSAVADGKVRIQAKYLYEQDAEANRADTWIYYPQCSAGGTDPDPDSDPETEVTMTFTMAGYGVALLDVTTDAYTDDWIYRVIVRTRNSGTPDLDSDDTTIYEVTINTDGPSDPELTALTSSEEGL